jgi:hypothetical protein
MRVPRSLNDSFYVLGSRVPVGAGVIVGAILALSALGAVGWRNGLGLLAYVGLAPDLVWSGQAWRLATWSFFELDGLSLLLALFLVFLLGRDLCYAWGGARFLAFWVGMTTATGICVCLLGWVWPEVWRGHYLSAWPVAEALTVAWALTYPSRTILFGFILPVQGMKIIYLSLGITVVYAMLGGLAPFVPHFLALGLAWIYMGGGWSYWWLRLKVALLPSNRPSHLRPVQRKDPPTWYH